MSLRLVVWLIQPVYPFPQPSDPEWRVQETLCLFGEGIPGRQSFEYLIINHSRVPLAYRVVIAAHDACKAREFRDVKSLAVGIQPFEIECVVKNVGDFGDVAFLETDVGIVDPGKEIVGMAAIGFQDTYHVLKPVPGE